jgi:RNA 2',3'-cyclic 3'-phosphodiesterase
VAVWLPQAVPPALGALHARLGAAMAALGLTVETRPFRPHVTLARRAAGALPPPPAAGLAWRADGYALVDSSAGYRVLARYPARGGTR